MIARLVLLLALLLPLSATADSLRVGLPSLPPGAGNPLTSNARTSWYAWRAIFDTFTILGEDMRPSPHIATAWEPVSPTLWRVRVREDVTFSNGEPLDAAAAVFSLNYLKTEAAARFSLARDARDILAVRVISPTEIEIETPAPLATLPNRLTALPLLPPGYWQEIGPDGFASRPVGSGPYKIEQWSSTRLELSAFQGSWRAPKLPTMSLLALPDTASRLQALVSGQTDLALEIAPDDVELLRAQGIGVYQRPSTSLSVIVLNVEKQGAHPALQDPRVRRALNHAINREAIGAVIWGGLSQPASQHTPRLNPAYDPSLDPYAYDPDLARSLLAEAGYGEGFTFVHQFAVGVMGAHIVSTHQQVAADLARVGVDMVIRPFTWPQLQAGVLQGEWEGDSFGFEYETLPTGETLRPFRLHSCSWPAPWYCDQEIEPVMQQAKETFDETERVRLLRQVLRRYHDQAPSLLLFEQLGLDGVSPHVRDYDQVNGIIPFSTVWVER